jgi:cation transport ATPase
VGRQKGGEKMKKESEEKMKKMRGKNKERKGKPRILILLVAILGAFAGVIIGIGIFSGGFLMENPPMEKLLYACIGLIFLLAILVVIYSAKKEKYGKAKIAVNALFILGVIAIPIPTIFGIIHEDWIVFSSGWIIGVILMVLSTLLGRSFVKSGAISKEELKDRYVLADERTQFIQGKSATVAYIISTFAFVFLVCICLMLNAGLWIFLLFAQYFALGISYGAALLYYKKRYGD